MTGGTWQWMALAAGGCFLNESWNCNQASRTAISTLEHKTSFEFGDDL